LSPSIRTKCNTTKVDRTQKSFNTLVNTLFQETNIFPFRKLSSAFKRNKTCHYTKGDFFFFLNTAFTEREVRSLFCWKIQTQQIIFFAWRSCCFWRYFYTWLGPYCQLLDTKRPQVISPPCLTADNINIWFICCPFGRRTNRKSLNLN
jgi:hypothetical protein